MKIGAEQVRHVARLAELAVAEEDVALLAAQLERIVSFVEQLNELELPAHPDPVVMGPQRLMLREDVVGPVPLSRTPAELAPEFIDGFFVVPKLGGLAES